MRSAFPYAGSKWTQRDAIWNHFGDPDHFIDPFCGSNTVLLSRPWPSPKCKSEIINDQWGFITNFWRAVKQRPREVARHCVDRPNELDLHARHAWLLAQQDGLVAKLMADPTYFDAKIAGWFCWGASIWFRHGWCKGYNHDPESRLMNVDGNRQKGVFRKKVDTGRGRGIQRQRLTDDAESRTDDLLGYFKELGQRTERVSVLCGDWQRSVSSLPDRGIVAVFLDPPYSTEVRKKGLYAHDGGPALSRQVRRWALANANDPRLRIAFCGLEDEHKMPKSWQVHGWTSAGGAEGRRHLERIWFSPHCLK